MKRKPKGLVFLDATSKSIQDLLKPKPKRCRKHGIVYEKYCTACNKEYNTMKRKERAADPFSIKKMFL